MTDSPTWYSTILHGDPEDAGNVFAIEAMRLTPDREMLAFLAAGGRLTDWLKMKETK